MHCGRGVAVGISAFAQRQHNHCGWQVTYFELSKASVAAEPYRITKCFASISGCVPRICHLHPCHETAAGMQPECAEGT